MWHCYWARSSGHFVGSWGPSKCRQLGNTASSQRLMGSLKLSATWQHSVISEAHGVPQNVGNLATQRHLKGSWGPSKCRRLGNTASSQRLMGSLKMSATWQHSVISKAHGVPQNCRQLGNTASSQRLMGSLKMSATWQHSVISKAHGVPQNVCNLATQRHLKT